MAAHAGNHTSVKERGDLLARPDVIGHTVSLGCLLWHYDELHFGPLASGTLKGKVKDTGHVLAGMASRGSSHHGYVFPRCRYPRHKRCIRQAAEHNLTAEHRVCDLICAVLAKEADRLRSEGAIKIAVHSSYLILSPYSVVPA